MIKVAILVGFILVAWALISSFGSAGLLLGVVIAVGIFIWILR